MVDMVDNPKESEEEQEGGETGGGVTSAGDAGAKALSKGSASKGRKRYKKHIVDGIVHVYASFNNTITTVTDVKGNTLSWATAGGCGFRGSRKSTPFAGQVATGKAVQKATELYGLESAEIRVYGPGPGRDASVRAVRDYLQITAIYDVTGIPFNGCRAQKERRV